MALMVKAQASYIVCLCSVCFLFSSYLSIFLFSLLYFLFLKHTVYNQMMLSLLQLSWWQLSDTLTRDRHRSSNRLRTSLRRSGTDWLSWSFKHRLDQLLLVSVFKVYFLIFYFLFFYLIHLCFDSVI